MDQLTLNEHTSYLARSLKVFDFWGDMVQNRLTD